MGRRSGGQDLLAVAKASLPKAKTIEGLRKLQAVVLPLEYGLTLDQTAQAAGVSVGWVSQLRNRFIQEGGNWRRMNDILNRTFKFSTTGKKFADTLAEVSKDWPEKGSIRLMFMDEAHFGRISETKRTESWMSNGGTRIIFRDPAN